MKEIDCHLTSEITCPYCGHEHPGSLDLISLTSKNGDEEELECHDCEKTFSYVINIETTFSSYKIEEDKK